MFITSIAPRAAETAAPRAADARGAEETTAYPRATRRPRRTRLAGALVPLLAALALTAAAPALARADGSIVVMGATPDTVYVAQPGDHTLMLLRRGGAVVATRHLDGQPSGMALDPRRGRLYVALTDGGAGIVALNAATLRPLLALHAPMGATGLAAVPGQDALYLYDPVTRRALYLTYTPDGAVHLSTVFGAISTPKAPSLHVTLEPAGPGERRVAFWANGFTPGEAVAVSWGAHDQGQVTADRYGIVSGDFAVSAPARRAPQGLTLYGLSSGRILTGLLGAAHARPRQARPHPAPPLYLGALPGPVATLTPPALRKPIRLPVSAGALPVLPIGALGALLAARKRKKRRAAAKKTPARRPTRK